MPAQSKAQQRLFGIAYAVKKGNMSIEDVTSEYKKKIKDLIANMSIEQLKDYAETDAKTLPDTVEGDDTSEGLAFAASYNAPQGAAMPGSGMGKISLPDMSTGATGSGDKISGQGNAEDEYKKEKKKRKKLLQMIKTYESFSLNESISFKAKYKLEGVKGEVSFLVSYSDSIVQFIPATSKDLELIDKIDASSSLQKWLDHKFGKGGFIKNQEGRAGYSFTITDDLIEDSILKFLKV
jgi:hypothetical protein